MPFSIGQNVGPYRILEHLGQGGMATVCKAYHASLDRFVALKVLHPAFREDPTFLARFTREARVVAKLEHPHIVPIYDYAEQDGQPYLVMKYIEGETLKARLARSPLSAEEAVRVVEAVGEALAFAHKRGILHRDIKPSNILLTPDGGIFLADFGLARIAQSGESTLSSDMLLGTPHYISPEQAQGVKNLDEGTDIYSLGVVLYELAVGRVPFNADTPFSIIHDHIYAPLPLPSSINPKVPPNVERVLLKALAKDRKDRYASVDALVKAFGAAVRGAAEEAKAAARPVSTAVRTKAVPQEPHAPQPTPVAPHKPWWKQIPRWLMVLAAVVLCLCLCLTGVAIVNSRRQESRATATALAAATLPFPEDAGSPVDIPQDAREAWSHLEQGLALLQAGEKEAADRELQTALERLPVQRTVIFQSAVKRISAAGDWLTAGNFLLKGLQGNQRDQELREAAMEVFFHVAGDPSGEAMLRPAVVEYPDWATAEAALSRWIFTFSMNPRDAEPILQKAKTDSKDYEVLMVKAVAGEFQCVTGNTVEGLRTLQGVLDISNIPPWLRVEVERMQRKWQ